MMKKKVAKKERLLALKRLIESHGIGNQTELQQELKKTGIAVTQATISRDLQDLNMVKVTVAPGVHQYKVIDMAQKGYNRQQLQRLFAEFVSDIRSTGNLILVKTASGNANTVAVGIDKSEFKEILGTVAGDDTVLVIAGSVQGRQRLEAEFAKFIK